MSDRQQLIAIFQYSEQMGYGKIMTELEILQQRFQDMSREFPGLMHILLTWHNGKKEPKVDTEYLPNEDKLIVLWGQGLVRNVIPDINLKHWLIKPIHAKWNKDEASENFRKLSESMGRLLCQIELLPQSMLTDPILSLSKYQLSHAQQIQFWALVVHQLGNVKQLTNDPYNSEAFWSKALNIKGSKKMSLHTCYEIQDDFFLESSLVISQFQKAEKGIAQLEMASKKLLPARHSPDFRSVHWYGTDHSFTATQAAIVKELWEAWENGTPDIGQAALLEKVGSDSKRLIDIFKNHNTYKQLIGEGKTKGSYRMINPTVKK